MNPRKRRVLLALAFYVLTVIGGTIYQIMTYKDRPPEDPYLEAQIKDYFEKAGGDKFTIHSYSPWGFVERHSVIEISRKAFETSKLKEIKVSYSWRPNFGNLAIFTLAGALLFGVEEYFLWSFRTVREHRLSVPPKDSTPDAIQFLFQEAARSEARATELQVRSTLMLVVGIAMAFVGVIVFWFSLREFEPKEDPRTYFLAAIRPLGMLVFIEGVAWFILRQYRALIDDYKAFFAVYIRRSNYLGAALLLSSQAEGEDHCKFSESARKQLAESLLEDQAAISDDKFRAAIMDQTAKPSDLPPIQELAKRILDKLPGRNSES